MNNYELDKAHLNPKMREVYDSAVVSLKRNKPFLFFGGQRAGKTTLLHILQREYPMFFVAPKNQATHGATARWKAPSTVIQPYDTKEPDRMLDAVQLFIMRNPDGFVALEEFCWYTPPPRPIPDPAVESGLCKNPIACGIRCAIQQFTNITPRVIGVSSLSDSMMHNKHAKANVRHVIGDWNWAHYATWESMPQLKEFIAQRYKENPYRTIRDFGCGKDIPSRMKS